MEFPTGRPMETLPRGIARWKGMLIVSVGLNNDCDMEDVDVD
jgi:hypothetical protein